MSRTVWVAALLALCACGSGGGDGALALDGGDDAGRLGAPGGDGGGSQPSGDMDAMVIDVVKIPSATDAGWVADSGMDASARDASAWPDGAMDDDDDAGVDVDADPDGDADGDGLLNRVDPCPLSEECDLLLGTGYPPRADTRADGIMPTGVRSSIRRCDGSVFADFGALDSAGRVEVSVDDVDASTLRDLRLMFEFQQGAVWSDVEGVMGIGITPNDPGYTVTRAIFYLTKLEILDCRDVACSMHFTEQDDWRWQVVADARWELRGYKN